MYAIRSYYGRTYKFMEQEPLFPFGFGLSFTTFEYKNMTINKTSVKKSDEITLSFDIENTGKIDGEDVAQLYLVPVTGKENAPKYRNNFV